MWKRLVWLLLCGLVIPACGGGSDSSSVPSIPDWPIPPGPGPFTLKSDDWSSGNPSPNWTIIDGPAIPDNTTGAPIGSMKVGAASDSGEVRSTYKFNVTNSLGGITIQVDAAYLAEIPSIKIYDDSQLPPASPVAIVTFFDSAIVYRVGSATFQQNVANDNNWHRYVLQLNGGSGTWKRDGVTQLTAPVALDWAVIYITSGFNVPVWVDNAVITAP
jgi:hypothetical protein